MTSGLSINYSKSSVIGVNIQDGIMRRWADILNCQVEKFPIKYLGLHLSTKKPKVSEWRYLEEKLERKLAGWKGRLMSPGGRLVLLRSVLQAVPIFHMSYFRLPKGVCNNLEKMCKNWLWRGGREKGRHLVKWKEVCKPLKEGGLDIVPLPEQNTALMAKWWWRWRTEPNSYWVRICASIFKGKSHKQSTWQQNVWACKEGIEETISCDIGEGLTTSFWNDRWAEKKRSLAEEFKELYKISDQKDVTVAESRQWDVAGWTWKINFRRDLREWEIESLGRMLEKLQQVGREGDTKDSWKWRKGKVFTVKDYREWRHNMGAEGEWEGYRHIWKVKSPPRVKFFMWTLALNKLVTKMRRKKWDSLEDGICALCKEEEEDTGHLFFKCKVTRNICLSLNKGITFLEDMEGSLFQIGDRRQGGKKVLQNEAVGFHACCWAVWLHRNDVIFNGAPVDEYKVCRHIDKFIENWKVL